MSAKSNNSETKSVKKVVFSHEIEIFENEFDAASNGEPPSQAIRDILLGEVGKSFIPLIHELCETQQFTRSTSARSWIWAFLKQAGHSEFDSVDILVAAFARAVATYAH